MIVPSSAAAASLLALPLLSSALPQPVTPPQGFSIPLRSRSSLVPRGPDHVANIESLTRHAAFAGSKYNPHASFAENFFRHTGKKLFDLVEDIGDAVGDAVEGFTKGKVAQRATFADPLTDYDGLWAGKITIGTPPVEFEVDWDTGSADLFVPLDACNASCANRVKYTPSQSSTSVTIDGQAFLLSYGDGSRTSGNLYNDTISAGPLTAVGATFGGATYMSNSLSFQNFPPGGLAGLSFPSLSAFPDVPGVGGTFLDALKAQGQLDAGIFGFYLREGEGSSLFFGGLEQGKYTGDVSWSPVVQESYWLIDLEKVISIGNNATASDRKAVIDSGTTLIYASFGDVSAFYSSIPNATEEKDKLGAGFWSFPCASAPQLSLQFTGKVWTVNSAHFNLGQLEAGSDRCIGGLVGMNTPNNYWIVGSVFMKGVYSAFDFDTKRVGFAQLA